MQRYFVGIVSDFDSLVEWKSKGLCNESIKLPQTGSNFIDPLLDYLSNKIRLKFSGNCLKQDKVTYNHRNVVNIYIVYEISKNFKISIYSTLENCLFGAVSLTKKILILIIINILDMELDFIDMDFFLILVVELVEM